MNASHATDATTLHVRAFRARHSAADADGLARCQAAQHQLLDGELEAALAALVGADEVVIVRRLQLQLKLNPARSDRDNARRWSDGLGQALWRALQHAPARDLQRFAHRRHALQAFVADAIAGSSARDWAWQRLGWLPPATGGSVGAAARHGALLRWLADDELASVPLLRGLLHTAPWPAFVAQLADAELRGLATSVLARLADDPSASFGDATVAAPAPAVGAATTVEPATLADWPAALRTTWQAAVTPARRRWALRLAWLLNDPPLARRGAAAVDAAIAQALAPDVADADAAAAPPAPRAAIAHRAAARAADAGDHVRADPPAGDSNTAMPLADEQTAWTAFGGLLLLLPLLPRCGALDLLEDAAVWPDSWHTVVPAALPAVVPPVLPAIHRAVRPAVLPEVRPAVLPAVRPVAVHTASWPASGLQIALHRLAQRLAPLGATDAAALAFCGLPPQAQPPQAGLVLSAAQQAALQQAQGRLTALLAAALPDWHGSAFIDRVAYRRARIVAEPGWIDVHFALRDVSLDLRRAALDLDPGFIPWLGLVLRYRYE